MVAFNPTSTIGNIVYIVPPPGGIRASQEVEHNAATRTRAYNFSTVDKKMVIENLRGKEESVTLDTAGYQFIRHTSKHSAFTDDEEIEREYYPESVELIKKLTGASKVVLFDHTIRRRRPGQIDDHPQRRQPIPQAHVDQTLASSIARVHRHIPPADVPFLLEKRFQIINLWRPISPNALDWPLALCDFRSVDRKEDTLPIALVYPNREPGETMGVKYNPNHKWTYFRGMTPDEAVLLKCFDSIQDGSVAIFTPHTGFEDPSTPEDAPLRESIEIRALVFYD
ncbi:hypothetical protein BDQ12DRAFT_655563 [Crucibulum laeve]|uniref:Methyltransferase n=1 Tax=Crucibulum laeve TaxID=68775 RepID=A0A5C3LQL0_9AGAR|nr:hypothetical protein BDQ12DRAFT_655563 [Crucibulum laeve]